MEKMKGVKLLIWVSKCLLLCHFLLKLCHFIYKKEQRNEFCLQRLSQRKINYIQFTLMEKFYALFNPFLPNSSKWTAARHRKSVILVVTHFFILIALTSLVLFSETIGIQAFIAIPPLVGSLLYFRAKGHLRTSGNVLATVWFLTLVPVLIYTGGLASSFLPWLYSVILVMVLIESYVGSTLWFLVASFTCVGFYYAGSYFPNLNISCCTLSDTLISYLSVGLFMFLNLAVFKQHQMVVVMSMKQRNQELKMQKKALSDHAQALEIAEQQLTLINKELQVFAYAASHDLKEPLRMIKMYTQLIEKRLKNVLDENTKEYMFFITDGVKRMQQLLDNLLAYSLLGRNVKDVQVTDFNVIMQKVLQNLTVLIQESQATFHYKPLPHIKASTTEMTQLFQNLIANALKFRKPDAVSVINIYSFENENQFLFSIEDNGIGIKREDQERIFDIFTRLNAQTDYEGTGIGLATCKKILTNMGGKIWVTSTEGVGTTFHFVIPKSEIQFPPKLESSVRSKVGVQPEGQAQKEGLITFNEDELDFAI
jgi:signal transduction histidine kinase